MPYINPPTQQPYPPPVRSLQGATFSTHGRRYELVVVQQPVRARMCGFGDKDRRPISPPPCIRLRVYDETTGAEVDPSELDAQHFVLIVDLWSADGNQEVNLVRSSNTSPAVSISAATTTAYPPAPERPFLGLLSPYQLSAYYRSVGDIQSANQLAMQAQYQQTPIYHQPVSPSTPQTSSWATAAVTPLPIMPSPTAGMFTRNLIGSLAVNAFKLSDDLGERGLWFILQDLSVRTEGNFRLKCSFVDVGAHDTSGLGLRQLNTGKAPVLATTYSETFQVYSAKKFPGVIESTPLSKAFAGQGIKIPIRKDGPKTVINAEEYANDEL